MPHTNRYHKNILIDYTTYKGIVNRKLQNKNKQCRPREPRSRCQPTVPDLGVGFFVTGACFSFGNLVSKFLPAIQACTFTIIFVAVLKLAGVLPRKIEYCAVMWYHVLRSLLAALFLG